MLIIGGGAAGLNAALQAKERGMRYVLLEKKQVANTIENFPEGKYVHAEPDTQPPKGMMPMMLSRSRMGFIELSE